MLIQLTYLMGQDTYRLLFYIHLLHSLCVHFILSIYFLYVGVGGRTVCVPCVSQQRSEGTFLERPIFSFVI